MTDEKIIDKLYKEIAKNNEYEDIIIEKFIEKTTGLRQDTPECNALSQRIWNKYLSEGWQTVSMQNGYYR